jgi:hypothetical protein
MQRLSQQGRAIVKLELMRACQEAIQDGNGVSWRHVPKQPADCKITTKNNACVLTTPMLISAGDVPKYNMETSVLELIKIGIRRLGVLG